MRFDDQGRELPDPKPVALPLGAKRPESITEQIRRLIRGEMSRQAVEEGNESFEEANDFDVDEPDAELHDTEYQLMTEELPLGGPRPRPGEDEEEDDDDEISSDSDSGGDTDHRRMSSGPDHDDRGGQQPPSSGVPTTGGEGEPGHAVVGDRAGGSGGQVRRRSKGVKEREPGPRPDPAKTRRTGR